VENFILSGLKLLCDSSTYPECLSRLPVPGLWLDVFQKMRSMGFTAASFYVDWALLEGKPGNFSATGVFDLQPFFDAAQVAGIYLLARPGPHINAEASGGGFPGWMQRVPGHLRTLQGGYMKSSDLYASEIGKMIAKAQITNGGPVILFQPENEYSPQASPDIRFPDPDYMNALYAQFRKAGINVPLVNNDASPNGLNAPGDEAEVDIYGHDGYPMGFDCSNPDQWRSKALPTDWRKVHMRQSPKTPYTIPEFQGGSFDPWGGPGMEKCVTLTGPEFERVFYKNMFAFGATVFNIYMTYGGTNWANLGHPHGYTSYDYGAVIAEDRTIAREKYSEAKLQATFIESSPAYLDADVPLAFTKGNFTDTDAIAVTQLKGKKTQFLIIRHDKYETKESKQFKLKVSNSDASALTIPQSGDLLTLRGRDSKILVIDYDVGGINLAYSTAEIFTWKAYSSKTVLIVYADVGDVNELAFSETFTTTAVPPSVTLSTKDKLTVINWTATPEDRVVKLGKLHVYLVDRRSAYSMWVLGMPQGKDLSAPYTGTKYQSAIIKGGYLMRTAVVIDDKMFLTGDVNKTTSIQIVGGAPDKLSDLKFNGKQLSFTQDDSGVVSATIEVSNFDYTLPDLGSAKWKVVDSLPEIKQDYSDSSWKKADLSKSYNDKQKQLTPTSLFSGDYGYHWGNVIFRGSFKSTGGEKYLAVKARGGLAYGLSAWMDNQFLGSYKGHGEVEDHMSNFTLPAVKEDTTHTFTILIDNMGYNENWNVGMDDSKRPIGILNYTLSGRDQSAISWKITGNLGGEDYIDRVRGPSNEGGLWAERNGYHLPVPPSEGWKDSKGPTEGLKKPGISLYSTSFDLNVPKEFDVPISIQIGNSPGPLVDAAARPVYRLQIYVNGWQFGEYINNIGPQVRFPVPEGILNHRGKNWLAITVWNLEDGEVKVDEVKLVAGTPIYSGMRAVGVVDSPPWSKRENVY
jgi:beta-galactosidase GanA